MSHDKRCTKISNGRLILKGIINDNLQSDTSKYLTGGIFTKYKKTLSLVNLSLESNLMERKARGLQYGYVLFIRGKTFHMMER